MPGKETEGEPITTPDDLPLLQPIRPDRSGSFFSPYRSEFGLPPMRDIIREIFDMDDPGVCAQVRGGLAVGRIIVGDYFPSTGEVIIQVPLETSGYAERRWR